ncbi:MAG: cytochrome c3 family protein [Isosphaeraceae bacterium]
MSRGTGWGRSVLDATHPSHSRPADFQGETIGVRAGLAKCLYCRVTNPRTGQDLLGPEMADRAIGRERCHGPRGNHIAALEAHFPDLAIVNPAAASPRDVTVKECNDCHVLEHRIRDGDPENPGWIRSQGIGWTRSRCNTESGGALGCLTCHDPHKAASAASATDYEARCLKCHSASSPAPYETQAASTSGGATGPEARACPVSATSGCISCHMPSVPLGALHVKLTDHHIRVRGRQP